MGWYVIYTYDEVVATSGWNIPFLQHFWFLDGNNKQLKFLGKLLHHLPDSPICPVKSTSRRLGKSSTSSESHFRLKSFVLWATRWDGRRRGCQVRGQHWQFKSKLGNFSSGIAWKKTAGELQILTFGKDLHLRWNIPKNFTWKSPKCFQMLYHSGKGNFSILTSITRPMTHSFWFGGFPS